MRDKNPRCNSGTTGDGDEPVGVLKCESMILWPDTVTPFLARVWEDTLKTKTSKLLYGSPAFTHLGQ